MLGAGGAFFTGSFLEKLVYGAKAFDPVTFAFSVLSLIFIAATSIWAGSRSIAGLDIVEILRVQ